MVGQLESRVLIGSRTHRVAVVELDGLPDGGVAGQRAPSPAYVCYAARHEQGVQQRQHAQHELVREVVDVHQALREGKQGG